MHSAVYRFQKDCRVQCASVQRCSSADRKAAYCWLPCEESHFPLASRLPALHYQVHSTTYVMICTCAKSKDEQKGTDKRGMQTRHSSTALSSSYAGAASTADAGRLHFGRMCTAARGSRLLTPQQLPCAFPVLLLRVCVKSRPGRIAGSRGLN